MANVALIANIADQTATTRTGTTSALVPSGVIFPYAGATTPSGWIVCDGTAYNQTDYPELFAALGSTYNTQINPTTGSAWAAPSAGQFRVPDMRGLFLRGEGTASGGDAVSVGGHQVGKTAKNGLGNAASAVSGSAASGGVDHNHANGSIYATTPGAGGATGTAVSGGGGGINWNASVSGGASAFNHTHSVSGTAAAQTITGDNETRPANRGVRYIIKL